MNRIRLMLCALVFAAVPAAIGWAPAQADRPDPPALVAITVRGERDLALLESLGVPVYERLEDGVDVTLLSGATDPLERTLRVMGLSVVVLDPDTRGANYYVAYLMPGRPAPNWSAYGRPLLVVGSQTVLRCNSVRHVERLLSLGAVLRAITLDPKPLRPAEPRANFPAQVTPDPAVRVMLAHVDGATVYSYTSGLSGESSVYVGGSPYTIATRNTYGGPPLQKATQYVGEHMLGLGLDVEYHTWDAALAPNVIGELTGSIRPDDVFILCGHLDDMPSGPMAPGADDNASGSVAVLVAADVLTQYQWGCTLRFAFWTGEEQGMLGSKVYAWRAYDTGENILGVLNLDMIAYNTAGSSRDIELHAKSSIPASVKLAHLFADVVDAYGLNLIPEINTNGTGASDHSSFWQVGYPSILGIEDFGDFNPWYHSTNDRLQNVDLEYYTDFVRAAVGTFAHMTGCLIPGAPGVLEGHVTAAGDGAPIAGATLVMMEADGRSFPTVADASGYFSRSLPVGIYAVTASAFGYLPAAASGVPVVSDAVTVIDLALALAPTHVVSGTITDAATQFPLAAQVAVLDTPVPPVKTDPISGYYSVTLPAGEYTSRASAIGFRPAIRPLIVDRDQDQSYSLEPRLCLLLVDDDQDDPNVRDEYTLSLQLRDVEYDLWDLAISGNPAVDDLLGYRTLFWFTGASSSGTLAEADQDALAEYLDSGGTLFLSSQDYLTEAGLTGFARDYLGVGAYQDDREQTVITGTHDYAGLGPYPLQFAFDNQSDAVSPGADGSTAFVGDQGGAAVGFRGDFGTVFLGFPLEAVADPTDRADVLLATLDFFGGCPSRDGWLEGRVSDSVSDQAVGEATVTALSQTNGSYLAYADAQGCYLATVPAGIYRVTASRPGYADQQVSGVVVPVGLTVTQDLALLPVPLLQLSPSRLQSEQYAGQVVTHTLWVTNAGAADLTFVVRERVPWRSHGSAGEIPWLAVGPVTGTVRPSVSVPLTVTLDATGLEPGPYEAVLDVETNDPAAPTTVVSVSLMVEAACQAVRVQSVATQAGGCQVSFVPEYSGDAPIAWQWLFEGGMPPTSSDEQPVDIGFGVSRTYAFTVTAINCGGSGSDRYLGVVTAGCCARVTGVVLDLATGGPIYPGTEVPFRADLAPDTAEPPFSYRIAVAGAAGGVQLSDSEPLLFSHVFPRRGSYPVTIEVWNCSAAETAMDAIQVEVSAGDNWLFLPLVVRPG